MCGKLNLLHSGGEKKGENAATQVQNEKYTHVKTAVSKILVALLMKNIYIQIFNNFLITQNN